MNHKSDRFKVVERDEIESILPRLRFDNKTVIVTGAARGLGSAVAITLAELGAEVAVVDVRREQICWLTEAAVSGDLEYVA
ncbi:MAG: SDR family NAD(P)-dependent oxidoreductase [Clostridiales bacterium]|nr:SDR family NAD(P)-dependent oxidoreductase [Clostridiales bacterium]